MDMPRFIPWNLSLMQDKSSMNYVQVLESLQESLLTMMVRKLVVNGKRCDVDISSLNVTLNPTPHGKTRRSLEMAKRKPTIA
jgi:hypothetical protein